MNSSIWQPSFSYQVRNGQRGRRESEKRKQLVAASTDPTKKTWLLRWRNDSPKVDSHCMFNIGLQHAFSGNEFSNFEILIFHPTLRIMTNLVFELDKCGLSCYIVITSHSTKEKKNKDRSFFFISFKWPPWEMFFFFQKKKKIRFVGSDEEDWASAIKKRVAAALP